MGFDTSVESALEHYTRNEYHYSIPIIKNADIFLTGSHSLFGSIIRVMLYRKDDKAPFNHIAGGVVPFKVIEALSTVQENHVSRYLTGKKRWCIIARHKYLTDEQRQLMVDNAREYVGDLYPYHKIGLQVFDNVLGWCGIESNWFSKNLSWSKRPYCSELWSKLYYLNAYMRINAVHWKSCTPDDWFEEIRRHLDEWEIIFQYNIDVSKYLETA